MSVAPVGAALEADVRVRRGVFALDVAVRTEPGRVLAVLGPNGAGKSTLLEVLAGLLPPDDGRVRVGDRTLSSAGGGASRVHVRPERRSVGLLGQDPLVFPHLDARENVAFGPRSAGRPAGAARAEATEWLAAVGLEGLERRRPAQLSGGQRQRVALARALAAQPAALLLDEPFAQLDVRTAAGLRDLVRAQVTGTGTPAVLVTHDVVDVLTVADDVVVLHDGRAVERGRPLDVLARPAHPFTAALAGVNLVAGTLVAPGLLEGPDGLRLPCRTDAAVGTRVQATFPPSAVTLDHPDAPERTDGAGWDARVVDLEAGPGGVRVRTTGDVLVDVPAALVAHADLQVGAPVRLRAPWASVHVRAVPTAR